MADPKRVARALQYQQDKPAWWDAVPVADAPGTVRTPTPQEMSWLNRLNELSAGAGKGIESQLEGYKNMVLHPVDTAQQMYQSGKAVVQDPSLLVKGLQAMGERAMGSPQGFGEVVGENINPRNLLRNLARPSMEELTVYHGTPHRFPATEANPLGEFDASKIGTGEGAQAYGHGLYVAESPDVAKQYQANLSTVAPAKNLVSQYGDIEKGIAEAQNRIKNYQAIIDKGGSDASRASRLLKINEKSLQDLLDMKAGLPESKGSLYHVDLPDPMIDKMLDWDKPLSEQPKNVQEALKRRITSVEPMDKFDMGGNSLLRDNRMGQYDKSRPYPWILEAQGSNGTSAFGLSQNDVDRMFGSKDVKDLTGSQIITRLAQAQGSQAAASEYLRNLGIPGIRYLDEGSRGNGSIFKKFASKQEAEDFAKKAGGTTQVQPRQDQWVVVGEPSKTRNFVIFPGEEQNLKILERK